MRKIIVSEFVTLDGVMEGPGSSDSFKHAGWTTQYADDAFLKFKHDELMSAGALLLGRLTYEGFANVWPTMSGTGDFGERMNSIQKFVVSTSYTLPPWNNTTIVRENVRDTILQLKAEEGKDVYVFGSSILLQFLLQENLVDEYTMLVYPVILGYGKRLFKEGAKANLRLLESRALNSSISLLRFATVTN